LETPDEAIDRIDDIGGPHSHTNYPWGWAQCGNSPFRWYKQNTHEGGVHVPLIVRWPKELASESGTYRHQFVSVSDVMPTVLELLNLDAPEVFRGIDQMPVTGHSFANILRDAEVPAANTLQYFENSGSRALITERDGQLWKAVTKHNQGDDFETEPWELYNLSNDPSECENLAEFEPGITQDLIDLWWVEAERHGVLPLDDRTLELFAAVRHNRSSHRLDGVYRYRPPMAPIPASASATTGSRWFELTANVTVTEGDEGVLWATGTENSGVSIFVQGGRLVADYNAFNEHTIVESTSPIPPGDVVLKVRLERTGRKTGWCEVSIDGVACGREEIPFYMRMVSSIGSSVGYDHGSPVSERYDSPFPFTGDLHEVEIRVPERRSQDEQNAAAQAEMTRQ